MTQAASTRGGMGRDGMDRAPARPGTAGLNFPVGRSWDPWAIQRISPRRIASATAAARSETPSLSYSRWVWVLTVLGSM